MLKFNPKGLIVTTVGLLIMWTVLATGTVDAFDNTFTVALDVFVTVTSIAVVIAKIQGRDAFGPAGALREIRRWLTRTTNHQHP